MKPIDMDLFDYYWQQGWPTPLLMQLFVDKIEIVPADKEGKPAAGAHRALVFVNSAGGLEASPIKFDFSDQKHPCLEPTSEGDRRRRDVTCFQFLVRFILPFLRIAKKEKAEPVTPPFSAQRMIDFKALVEAAKSQYRLDTSAKGGPYQIVRDVTRKVFCIVSPDLELEIRPRRSSSFGCPEPGVLDLKKMQPANKRQDPGQTNGPGPGMDSATRDFSAFATFCGGTGRCLLIFHLRSPEAMLYHVGRVARRNMAQGRAPTVFLYPVPGTGPPRECAADDTDGLFYQPLIKVRSGDIGKKADLSVRYDGQVYSIPSDGCHESMHVISLLTQLIGLQRKADTVPRVTPVQIIGP